MLFEQIGHKCIFKAGFCHTRSFPLTCWHLFIVISFQLLIGSISFLEFHFHVHRFYIVIGMKGDQEQKEGGKRAKSALHSWTVSVIRNAESTANRLHSIRSQVVSWRHKTNKIQLKRLEISLVREWLFVYLVPVRGGNWRWKCLLWQRNSWFLCFSSGSHPQELRSFQFIFETKLFQKSATYFREIDWGLLAPYVFRIGGLKPVRVNLISDLMMLKLRLTWISVGLWVEPPYVTLLLWMLSKKKYPMIQDTDNLCICLSFISGRSTSFLCPHKTRTFDHVMIFIIYHNIMNINMLYIINITW